MPPIAANIGLSPRKRAHCGRTAAPCDRRAYRHRFERRLPRHAGKRRQRPIGQVGAVPALHIGRGDIPCTLLICEMPPASPSRRGNGEASRWPARTRCPRRRRPRRQNPWRPGEQGRRHAPEQRQRDPPQTITAAAQTGKTPISATVGAAESVLAAGSNCHHQQPGWASRSRHLSRSRRRPRPQPRWAESRAISVSRAGHAYCPGRECEAEPARLRARANGTPGIPEAARNLHAHPRMGGEKRLLTRCKREQHLPTARATGAAAEAQGAEPELAQARSAPVAPTDQGIPDHPQHRRFRARHALKRASTRRHALLRIPHRRIEGRQADAGGNASRCGRDRARALPLRRHRPTRRRHPRCDLPPTRIVR